MNPIGFVHLRLHSISHRFSHFQITHTISSYFLDLIDWFHILPCKSPFDQFIRYLSGAECELTGYFYQFYQKYLQNVCWSINCMNWTMLDYVGLSNTINNYNYYLQCSSAIHSNRSPVRRFTTPSNDIIYISCRYIHHICTNSLLI